MSRDVCRNVYPWPVVQAGPGLAGFKEVESEE